MLFEHKTEIQNTHLEMQLRQERESAIFTYLNLLRAQERNADECTGLLI